MGIQFESGTFGQEIKFTGGRELERALARLPGKLAKRAFRRAGAKALAPILREARARAPRGPRIKKTPQGTFGPGELRKNIAKKTILKFHGNKGATVRVIVGMRTSKIHRGFVGRLIETGFRPGRKDGGPTQVPPKPFLEPAFDARSNEAMRIFTAELRKELSKAAADARR